MGRKIPGRKHHGVRDPEKQRIVRFNRIKDKINTPPSNPDDQQVPKSVQRIAELREKVKNGFYNVKKAKNPKPKNHLEQRPNESNRQFYYRVHLECETLKREAAFQKKYSVEIEKNEEGEVECLKKLPKDPVQVMMKEARKKQKKKKDVNDNKLSKSQKRRLKMTEKKNKKANEQIDEFDKFRDEVKFGEQVHAPPTLTAPKLKIGAPKLGKKDLLLNSLFDKTSNKTIDRSGKRKELPNALRRQLDQQQKEVIEAYRRIKGKKHGT